MLRNLKNGSTNGDMICHRISPVSIGQELSLLGSTVGGTRSKMSKTNKQG
jgi:hypothetical protein